MKFATVVNQYAPLGDVYWLQKEELDNWETAGRQVEVEEVPQLIWQYYDFYWLIAPVVTAKKPVA